MCSISKGEQYDALVKERKACRRCQGLPNGLRNPADAELAEFDSDEIGPWSRLHGDLDADLMIIGKDWGGIPYYVEHRGLDDLQRRPDDGQLPNPTMRALDCLLPSIERGVPFDSYDCDECGLFLTNAVLCLKEGNLRERVNPDCFENCAYFLRRQIQIVAPRVAVALGQDAHQAVLRAFCPIARVPPLQAAVKDENGLCLSKTTRLLAVFHPGYLGSISRSCEQQREDWQRVPEAMRRNPCAACLNGQGYPHPFRPG